MARAISVLPPVAHDLSLAELPRLLAAGWADFRATWRFGLGFAGSYVGAGLLLLLLLQRAGAIAWLVPAAAGFPLLAPFVAVGLYDVSRRHGAGLPLGLDAIWAVWRGPGGEQVLSMGVIVFVAFSFWLIIAHSIFAVFMADAGSDSLAMLLSPDGLVMLAVGSAVGAVLALGFFAVTVVSLPMLVDRDVDFLTAIITSLAAMRGNGPVLLAWAVLIAGLLFLAMLPAFLGLLVALPVLGHATWHLYRRLVP